MYEEMLEKAKGFGDIFNLVKMATNQRLGLHRAGLSLVLMDLQPNVLAQHQIGSNAIIMDKKVLEAVNQTLENKVERNSYVFVVLLHEYLHSFGITSEERVRTLVMDVVDFAFPGNHPAHGIALNPLSLFDEKLIIFRPSHDKPYIIKDFDRESMPYIG